MKQKITAQRLRNLRDTRDDELCTDPQVWIDLFKEEGLPATMESVEAWIEPPPRRSHVG